jgi:YidC/Oxa1 family membrane protein insertase
MSDDNWYYAAGDKAVGPLSLVDLTAILSRVSDAENVLVWRTGFDQWQRAATVSELAAIVIKSLNPPPLPPPLPRLPPDLQADPSMVSANTKNDEDRPKRQKPRLDRVDRTKSRTSLFAALVLSGLVLLVWSYFFGLPQMQRQEARMSPQTQTQTAPASGGGQTAPVAPGQAASAPQPLTRDDALMHSTRVDIMTPSIKGSIALKGGRIDDVLLSQYHETVDPNSPPIELLSPSGSPQPFYAEFGWVSAASGATKSLGLPNADTVWKLEGSGPLTPSHPIVLTYASQEGLAFRRTISIDDKYLFTIKDEVANRTAQPVTLYPYGLISRHGTPPTLGYYILHEGLIGELGDQGLQEITYKKIDTDKKKTFTKVENAWLGITDKYWAAALLPDPTLKVDAEFSAIDAGPAKTYQADYLLPEQVIAPGATGTATGRLFAGAKEVHVINAYNSELGLRLFDRLIDWGWFWFFTKPLFIAIDYFHGLVGNFGAAILLFTTMIKIIYVPFANQSYRSLIKLGRLQPQIAALREQFPEKADQKIIELYKREKVTAPSGCLPMVLQFFLWFALYKVLLNTIEMWHAPFFGWIHDLSAPDPTNIFTLFGAIPWDPSIVPFFGSFLHLGALPILLGLSVFQLQRNIRPTLLDRNRSLVYDFLPFIVLYFTRDMMAGALIYLTWFNVLSIVHQLMLIRKEQIVVENISKYSAERLSNGLIQPVVLLTMLTPILQNVLTVLVFWRRSKYEKTKDDGWRP